MIPEALRFHSLASSWGEDGSFRSVVVDADQRRDIVVTLPAREESLRLDSESPISNGLNWQLWDAIREEAEDVVKPRADDLAPDIVAIHVVGEAKTKVLSNNPADDATAGTHYVPLEEYQCPANTMTLLRSDLTELDRLTPMVDLVSYHSPQSQTEKKVVFKSYRNWTRINSMWNEVNVLLRLPPHPNILPLDAIVLEEINGRGVVGFTTPFVPNGDLGSTESNRPFKLKWLRQLMQVVDDLNYKFGIAHLDIAPRNLLVNPDTDNLLLLDFRKAAKIEVGRAPSYYETLRRDVKGVIFATYKLITRDPNCGTELHDLHTADIWDPKKWVKHPDVQLDDGLDTDVYLQELMLWSQGRRTLRHAQHRPDTSNYIDWPARPAEPPETYPVGHGRAPAANGSPITTTPGGRVFRRRDRRRLGVPFLEWQRPPASKVDPKRRLLATGKYADEVEADGGRGGSYVLSLATSICSEDNKMPLPAEKAVEASGSSGHGNRGTSYQVPTTPITSRGHKMSRSARTDVGVGSSSYSVKNTPTTTKGRDTRLDDPFLENGSSSNRISGIRGHSYQTTITPSGSQRDKEPEPEPTEYATETGSSNSMRRLGGCHDADTPTTRKGDEAPRVAARATEAGNNSSASRGDGSGSATPITNSKNKNAEPAKSAAKDGNGRNRSSHGFERDSFLTPDDDMDRNDADQIDVDAHSAGSDGTDDDADDGPGSSYIVVEGDKSTLNDSSKAAASHTPRRPRGRPPKRKDAPGNDHNEHPLPSTPPSAPQKKKRGRPPLSRLETGDGTSSRPKSQGRLVVEITPRRGADTDKKRST